MTMKLQAAVGAGAQGPNSLQGHRLGALIESTGFKSGLRGCYRACRVLRGLIRVFVGLLGSFSGYPPIPAEALSPRRNGVQMLRTGLPLFRRTSRVLRTRARPCDGYALTFAVQPKRRPKQLRR